MKIGLAPYLNTLPFRLSLDETDIYYAPPTALNSLFKEKKLDIALISSISALENGSLLWPYGIGAKEKVMSVNFYVREDLNKSTLQCALTEESATSVKLLSILAKHKWHLDLQFEPLLKPFDTYESFLLIGNQALENQNIANYKTYDLASHWFALKGLPFVFALFVAHKVDEKTIKFCQKLQTSLHLFQTQNDKVVEMAVKRYGFKKEIIKTYFSSLQFTLDDEHKKGLSFFSSYVQ